MIILGVALLILGLLLSLHVVWIIGLVLLTIGALLWFLGTAGHPVGGRRYWY